MMSTTRQSARMIGERISALVIASVRSKVRLSIRDDCEFSERNSVEIPLFIVLFSYVGKKLLTSL